MLPVLGIPSYVLVAPTVGTTALEILVAWVARYVLARVFLHDARTWRERRHRRGATAVLAAGVKVVKATVAALRRGDESQYPGNHDNILAQ